MEDRRAFGADSDHILELLERLHTLEDEKQRIGVGSPEFVSLAGEIERLSRLVFRWSGMEVEHAEQAATQHERGVIDDQSLDQLEPRPLDVILSAWRDAQFRSELARPGSEEASDAAADIERLHEEFHDLQSRNEP